MDTEKFLFLALMKEHLQNWTNSSCYKWVSSLLYPDGFEQTWLRKLIVFFINKWVLQMKLLVIWWIYNLSSGDVMRITSVRIQNSEFMPGVLCSSPQGGDPCARCTFKYLTALRLAVPALMIIMKFSRGLADMLAVKKFWFFFYIK